MQVPLLIAPHHIITLSGLHCTHDRLLLYICGDMYTLPGRTLPDLSALLGFAGKMRVW